MNVEQFTEYLNVYLVKEYKYKDLHSALQDVVILVEEPQSNKDVYDLELCNVYEDVQLYVQINKDLLFELIQLFPHTSIISEVQSLEFAKDLVRIYEFKQQYNELL